MRALQKGFAPILWIFIVFLLLVLGYFAEPWVATYIASGTFGNPVKPVEIQGDVIHARGTYSVSGHSITVTMQIPKNGGALTGEVSGDCTGTISGTYSGTQGGLVDATGKGTCAIGPLKVPGTGVFGGTVFESKGTIDLSLSGKALGYSHSGSMTLQFE